MRKTKYVAALGLSLALGVSGLAFADGASDNQAFVDGKVSPKKLDKKKYKKVNLFLGVRNVANVTGSQSNPASEYISVGKNVKIDLKKADTCSAPLPNGMPTQQARATCPKGSYLGEGDAAVQGPAPFPPVTDVVVSVFNGPGKNEVRLHTYSPTLLGASPVVSGKIVKSKDGTKYGQALQVANAPETGALMITKFNATISKKSGVATARCKSKKIPFLRTVTYKDGSSETASKTQKCKRKR